LARHVVACAGGQFFMGADVPHVPGYEADEPCVVLVVHASGSGQTGTLILRELGAVLAARPPVIIRA
jgi:uncharacterized RmlC-like cupin family protein